MKKYKFLLAFAFILFLFGFNTTPANALVPGCSGTSGYSYLTGESCSLSNFPPGCTSSIGYSWQTGEACSGSTSNFPPGCTSTQGYSWQTGERCDGTVQPQPTYPSGCSSYSGYSSMTGERCDGSTTSAPVVNVSASPSSVYPDEPSTITWSSTGNFPYCLLYPFGGLISATGSFVVYPASTTTYSVTCETSGGTGTDSVKVTVKSRPTQTYPSGCYSGSVYSSTTGERCDGTSYTPPDDNFLPGCSSYSGYSSINGEPCS